MVRLQPVRIEGVSTTHRLVVSAVVAWKDTGRIGSRDEAIAAVREGALVTVEACGALLDATLAAHGAAVASVPLNVKQRSWRRRLWRFASWGDIAQEPCLARMQAAAPDLPPAVHEYLLGWVIYWYYER